MTGLGHLALPALLAASIAACFAADGYQLFVIGTMALTVAVGAGLNILLGLTGQVSIGHVGFYAIGAYAVAILTSKVGLSFWVALLLAGLLSGAVGTLLAMPALRVRGPYLAMITIAFGFIVEHGAVEWRALTGGANGLMGIPAPSLFGFVFKDREVAILAVVLAALVLFLFKRLSASAWGAAMRAVRDAETAAESVGINPVGVLTVAFALSAVATGLAGGLSMPLTSFVSPSAFPFFQSILFLLVVIVGGAGTTLGPLVGSIVIVLLPELLSDLAEYRLLFFGALLLLTLRLAPSGIVGAAARRFRKPPSADALDAGVDVSAFLSTEKDAGTLKATDLTIAFGGIRAVTDVSFMAMRGRITSLIGPNGAGKTTVLNLLSGFYMPDGGRIELGGNDLTRLPAHAIAREGIARTYQTTQLFGQMSVLDNVVLAERCGRLERMFAPLLPAADPAGAGRTARALLGFVGFGGSVHQPAGALAHVDKRLVEIARALAMQPQVLLLDEPAAGLSRGDKDRLARLLRRIADFGIAVILVEHDMDLVMTISDTVVVLDAGRCIAAGTPVEVRADPAVRKAYLGDTDIAVRPRAAPARAGAALLSARGLVAGYDAAPVLKDLDVRVDAGEMVAILGANGAGKTTLMRVLGGLKPAGAGTIGFGDQDVTKLPAHRIVRLGLVLVPEGRQVFPELTVLDNIRLGAFARSDSELRHDLEPLLERFPRLRERLNGRAGLLSGGEQQMLAIARGLMARPKLLMLDEPSLGLAPQIISELFTVLARLRDEDTTILLVDQMAALALALADRAYVLDSGTMVTEAPAAELRDSQALEHAYLGAAQARTTG
jgi:branched-chain amino acid transport system ATP-binding protein